MSIRPYNNGQWDRKQWLDRKTISGTISNFLRPPSPTIITIHLKKKIHFSASGEYINRRGSPV